MQIISMLQTSSSGYVKKLSVKECTEKAPDLKLARHQDGHWYISTPKKRTLKLLEALGVFLEDDVKKFNSHVYGALNSTCSAGIGLLT